MTTPESSARLTFVTSLRHPETTDDYALCESLLGTTLRSLDAGADGRCRAVVVANVPFAVPADVSMEVEVVVVDFPVPPIRDAPVRARQAATRFDRGTKIALALARIHDGHVMYVDSDDFVSRRVAPFVLERPAAAGWYVEDGFRYDARHGLTKPQPDFNSYCGTSLIFRRDLLGHLEDAPAVATQDELVAVWGEDAVVHELGSHRHLRERLGLEPLPFPGSMYSVNTGANVSRKGAVLGGRPLTAARAAEFGIPRPPVGAMWSAAAGSQLRRVTRKVRSSLRRPSAAKA